MKIKRVETFYTIVISQGFVMSTSQNQSMKWHIRILLINISSKNMAPNHPVHLTYHKITTKDCSNSYEEPSIINVQEKTFTVLMCTSVCPSKSCTQGNIFFNSSPDHIKFKTQSFY